jgi:hypothetical protein
MRIPILLVLTAGLCAATPDFRQLMHEGQAALAKADADAALKSFELACGPAFDAMPADRRASCEHHLALVDQARGNFALAEARLTRALNAWQEAGEGFQASYAMSLLNLGELCRVQRRFSEAEGYLKRGVDLSRLSRGDYPQEYPEALSRLAGAYAEWDKHEMARPLLAEAIGIFRGLAPRENAEEARALNALGAIDMVTGRNAEADALLSEAASLAMTALGPDHPNTAAYQADLALVYIHKAQYSRAEPLLKRARFVMESRPHAISAKLGIVIAEQGIVACGEGKFAMAEEYSREAMEIFNRMPGTAPRASLLAQVSLGTSWLNEHRLAEAEQILTAAIGEERKVAPETCLLADGLRELAALRAAQRSWRDAAALAKEAIGIYQNRLGPNSPGIVPLLKEYADILKHEGGSKTEAKAVEMRAKTILGFVPQG